MSITVDDITTISRVLNVPARTEGNSYHWMLTDVIRGRQLAVTVYIDIEVGGKSMSLVAVQSVHGYFELHNWTEFVVVEPDEVIFLSSDSENISSLVVSSHCSCSVYSNVSKQILTQDLTTLDPAVLLSAMQLSLVESLIQEA